MMIMHSDSRTALVSVRRSDAKLQPEEIYPKTVRKIRVKSALHKGCGKPVERENEPHKMSSIIKVFIGLHNE